MSFSRIILLVELLLMMFLLASKSVVGQNSFFLENKGQIYDQDGVFNSEVKYVLSLPDYNVSFYEDHFSYEIFSQNLNDSTVLNVERVEVWFSKSKVESLIVPKIARKEVINVFKNGKSFPDIKSFESIFYKGIQEGLDIEFFIQENQLKYNYIVSNVSLKEINLSIKGGKVIKKNDEIYYRTKSGFIKESIPESYYLTKDGKKKKINIVTNTAKSRVQFLLPKNRTEELIIDPIAYGNQYTTYYGGSHMDFAHSIEVSKTKDVIVTGFTVSTNNIATTGAHQTTISDQDAFIASFDENGNRNWSTYFGGESQERIYSAALDTNDNIFIAGNTTSQIGLATSGAYQQYISSGDDGFIAKFSPSGILDWSSYYGGDGHELITVIKVDDSNKLYVTGHTASTDLPCTPDAFRSSLVGFENAFLGVFNNDGSVIYNSYYIKGSNTRGEDLEITKEGTVYIAGYTNDAEIIMNANVHQSTNGGFLDGFLIKLDENYETVWRTYFGGENNDLIEGIALDSLENIYAVGKTKSQINISSANGLQTIYQNDWDGFVFKMDSASSKQWGSYIFAGGNDEIKSVKIKDSIVWLLGSTNGNSLIVDSSALQIQNNGGFDNFFMALSDSGGLLWSTYFGSSNDEFGNDLFMSNANKFYVAGQSKFSTEFTTSDAHQANFGGNLYDGYWSVFCKPVAPTLLSEVGSFSICEGDSLIVNSINSFNSYTWSNGDTTSLLNIKQSGNYVLKTIDINSCPGRSDTINVTIIPEENIEIIQSSTAICKDDSVMLSFNGSYDSYQWSTGETTSSIYVNSEQDFSVITLSNSGCQYYSDTLSLSRAQYNYPISIVGGTTICSGGESILFTSESFNSLQWNTNLTNNSITVNTSGDYYFSGLDSNNCPVVSDTISITQVSYNSPSQVLDTISSFSVCLGDTISLEAVNGFTSYEWSNGENNQTIDISTTGSYYVSATDTNNCIGISDSIEVIVNQLPDVKIYNVNDTVCLNDSLLVSATNQNFQSYNWTGGVSVSSYYFQLLNVGISQITLDATDINGCSNSDTISFEIIDCMLFSDVNEKRLLPLVEVNPTSEELRIVSDQTINNIKIYDYQGKMVVNKEDINQKEISVMTLPLNTSIYIIEIRFKKNDKTVVKKFSMIGK